MHIDIELENRVVLSVIQALIGTVTPQVKAVSVEISAPNLVRLHVVLSEADPVSRELLGEVVDDAEGLADEGVSFELVPWVGTSWSEGWPGRRHRMIFGAYQRHLYRTD